MVNQTHDLLAHSAMPQLTVPQCGPPPQQFFYCSNCFNKYNTYIMLLMWNIFFTDASFVECNQRQCGVGTIVKWCLWQKDTRTWSAGLRLHSYFKEAVGIESTGNMKTRKMEKSCCIVFCTIFHAYCMGLHWWSYGTLSAGLESKIIRTVMAIVAVSVSTTWTLCATWFVLSAFRIACQLSRILCVWTAREFGSLHIFSRHRLNVRKNQHAMSFCCQFPLIISIWICFLKDHMSYYEVTETCEAWSGFVFLFRCRWLINVCRLEASSLHTVGVWQRCVSCVVLSALQPYSIWTVCCMEMKYKRGEPSF